MSTKVTGTVVYNDIEMGFWGIEADDGNKWLPINMPNQLKVDGTRVEVSIMKVSALSFVMWGQPCQITRFETIDPSKA